ncbi:hypothetical protein [Burkholderia stagnalis]|uniref:hypothetical protein n=1 Tax=Burkholderia stagnalis TaxID=1503054 RepID=UPI000F597452|nr:hypothetical protein [Burkholderia stagnalis]
MGIAIEQGRNDGDVQIAFEGPELVFRTPYRLEVWDEDPDEGPLFTLPADTPTALLPSVIAIVRKAYADGVVEGQRAKAAEIRLALDL